jgi:hypothetical protein
MEAIVGGRGTNPGTGNLLTWVTRDPNMQAQATVLTSFSGGVDVETDGELASRIAGIVRHRPGGGNSSQVRQWARAVTSSIEDGFVYPCAFNAGSTLVCIVQKRGGASGVLARQPNTTVLANAIAYLTPPYSPVFNPRSFVLVTGWAPEYSDLVLRMTMAKGAKVGWQDARPFPSYNSVTPQIVAVEPTPTIFTMSCPGDATLPGAPSSLSLGAVLGGVAPKLMLWDKANTRFAVASVYNIQDLGSSQYRVILNSLPDGLTPDVGMRVSPALDDNSAKIVSQAIRDHFDALGPGELFDLDNDDRGGRCVRFVPAAEEKPYRAGALVATRVIEALGGTAADAELDSISQTVPSYPTNVLNGPNMLVCGHVGIYEL